jgi:hypothetical protein
MKTLATIRSAKAAVTHQGTEEWAIKTICQMSDLDISPAEVAILRHDTSGDTPTGMRYVMSGGSILGSYSLELS